MEPSLHADEEQPVPSLTDILSHHVSRYIFCLLDVRSRARAACVCRAWRAVLSDDVNKSQFVTDTHDQLLSGQAFRRAFPNNADMRSPNRRILFSWQTDGNLVVYNDGEPVWALQVEHVPYQALAGGSACLTEDGQLQVQSSVHRPQRVEWRSPLPVAGWPSKAPFTLYVLDQGFVAIKDREGGVVWRAPAGAA